MSRDHRLLLEDIAGACNKIIRYSTDRSRDAVLADELRFDAILLNFLVIGEAVKNLPDDFRNQHDEIPWREIAGLRDFVAHAYFALDVDILQLGNPGDVRPVGEGVSELRVPYGPGYRVYFVQRGAAWVVLLAGGDKKTQRQDIKTAQGLARGL